MVVNGSRQQLKILLRRPEPQVASRRVRLRRPAARLDPNFEGRPPNRVESR